MQHRRHFVSQDLFRLIDLGAAKSGQAAHFGHRQLGIEGQALTDHGILDIAPELEELIGRGQSRIEPNGTLFGLAHLAAVAVFKQRGRDAKGLLAGETSHQLHPRQDIAPLIIATHLQGAALGFKQVQEVIALQNHVVKFKKRQALFQPLLEAFRRQHAVDAKVRPDLAQQVQVIERSKPIVVVDHDGLRRRGEVDIGR